MFTTDNIKKTTAKFDELLSKRPRPRDPSASPVAYQNLSVVKKLGNAKFPVYLTSSKIDNQKYAMKVFSHQGEKPHPYFKNEVRFSSLNHPNVINMIHYENERDTVQKGEVKRVSYILMEYAPYGDFFDFISKNGENFDDKLIRSFFRQLVDGMEYLHETGIAHLDLKPENLLLGGNFNLKIADFDLSHVKGDSKILSRGTKYYRGPELTATSSSSVSAEELKNPFAADIYSAGIILFILKSAGIYPHSEDTAFEGLNLADLMYNNIDEFWKKHIEIQEKKDSFFDKDFRELFNAMIKYNPEERISLKEIKQSKWYNGPIYTPFDLERKMKQILKC
jgi:serine/threonine protein kinase